MSKFAEAFNSEFDNESFGKTVIMDMAVDETGPIGLSALKDYLDVCRSFVTAAKIWTFNAALLDEDYIRSAVRLYRDADVDVFAGGLLFEYAYTRQDIDGLSAHLRHVGIPGIEISENYVKLDDDGRRRMIERLASSGLHVVLEYGEKHPEAGARPEDIISFVDDYRNAGVGHILIEQGEIDALTPADARSLLTRPEMADVFIEIDQERCPQQLGELVTTYGPGINLANVAPNHALRLAAFRRGLGRQIDYPFLRRILGNETSGKAGGEVS